MSDCARDSDAHGLSFKVKFNPGNLKSGSESGISESPALRHGASTSDGAPAREDFPREPAHASPADGLGVSDFKFARVHVGRRPLSSAPESRGRPPVFKPTDSGFTSWSRLGVAIPTPASRIFPTPRLRVRVLGTAQAHESRPNSSAPCRKSGYGPNHMYVPSPLGQCGPSVPALGKL